MMIRVDDTDVDNDDLLDRVIVDMVLGFSSSYSSINSHLGYYNRVTMTFRFRVICDTNYYGADCTRFCVSQDSNTLGHYTCNANGDRVCLDGYTGVDCLTRE